MLEPFLVSGHSGRTVCYRRVWSIPKRGGVNGAGGGRPRGARRGAEHGLYFRGGGGTGPAVKCVFVGIPGGVGRRTRGSFSFSVGAGREVVGTTARVLGYYAPYTIVGSRGRCRWAVVL